MDTLTNSEDQDEMCENANISYGSALFAQMDLKKCWFAMLLPTHPKQALPKKKCIAFLRIFFFFLLFSKYF